MYRSPEGSFTGNCSAVLRFPSMVLAEEWYDSVDYAPDKEMRINEPTDFAIIVFIDGM